MANNKGPVFIQKIKAKLLIKDEVQKLEHLSNELISGKASEADVAYWELSIAQMEEYIEFEPSYTNTLNKYTEELKWLKHKVHALKVGEYDKPLLIASSLYGLFDSLILQREKNTGSDDIVIVMGDWMAFEGDMASIEKAMDLIEEGVIFLRGKNEELFVEQADKDSIESRFIQSLPTDVQTDSLIVTTGNSAEEPIQMSEFVTSDSPNLTGKTIITVQPKEGENSAHDSARSIIMLAPGDAIKLNLREDEPQDVPNTQTPNEPTTQEVLDDEFPEDEFTDEELDEINELKRALESNE